ncbi:tRNA (guanine-N(7)-)-methyltransferase [Paenibacillus curdlanolyticus YK9]|uniref:tRNA (guanine-N(7)-)-methyltransferase n=1 Tax=Paenibacillus curdlanolyticus YK9 TaxID=717606 RepID=E0I6L7_9BACL|nr:tRNA (guanosine(46)-N7)-methyltransferase TrmB [Paenibacillus curdlanolyticus]EFM11683.1 tRNA (guanine-N(7)-)-methyltransferase [Paenibacillus curdlanolyticus YK9]
MRLRGRKGILESIESQPELVVLDGTAYKGRWHEFFGNDHPIYVELGMGKGQFISTMSFRNPEINYIGVDMYDELIRRGAEKARNIWAERGVDSPPNLALLRANIEGIENIFDKGELERVYLNFSDPWPKAKHARRRLTHPRFVRKYMEALNARGEIHFKTDSQSLFEFSLNSFADMELLTRNIALNLHKDGLRDDLVPTEYEMKFYERGQNIHRIEVLIGEEPIAAWRQAKREASQVDAEAAKQDQSDDEDDAASEE